jgi:hypothetical protein
MRSELTAIAFFVGGLVLLISACFLLVNTLAESECRRTAQAMGVEYHYAWNVPCLIKPEGKPWVPLRLYRVI